MSKNWHVLLVVDNCPAHPHDYQMSNITIKFLPPNTTAKLQPCGQGIIRSLKEHCHYYLLKKISDSMEADKELKVTVLDAMQWLNVARDEVTPITIQNCFHHCSFRSSIADSGGSTEVAQHELPVSSMR